MSEFGTSNFSEHPQETDDLLDIIDGDDVETHEEHTKRERDSAIDALYVHGFEPAEGQIVDGITHDEFTSWLTQLSDEDRLEVEASRAAQESKTQAVESTKEAIAKSEPRLLQGRLPERLETLVDGEYALGVNQSDGCRTLSQASQHLRREGGIALQGYDIRGRFLLADSTTPEYASTAVAQGYYGPEFGRFIVAFPTGDGEEGLTPQQTAGIANTENLPEDIKLVDGQGEEVINQKYIAGFIDVVGDFYVNQKFMKSNAFEVADLV